MPPTPPPKSISAIERLKAQISEEIQTCTPGTPVNSPIHIETQTEGNVPETTYRDKPVAIELQDEKLAKMEQGERCDGTTVESGTIEVQLDENAVSKNTDLTQSSSFDAVFKAWKSTLENSTKVTHPRDEGKPVARIELQDEKLAKMEQGEGCDTPLTIKSESVERIEEVQLDIDGGLTHPLEDDKMNRTDPQCDNSSSDVTDVQEPRIFPFERLQLRHVNTGVYKS
tara:strand:+ start:2801 stop:3481 length:681 start_codon:yes stop_codon:yes gene_type:complete